MTTQIFTKRADYTLLISQVHFIQKRNLKLLVHLSFHLYVIEINLIIYIETQINALLEVENYKLVFFIRCFIKCAQIAQIRMM